MKHKFQRLRVPFQKPGTNFFWENVEHNNWDKHLSKKKQSIKQKVSLSIAPVCVYQHFMVTNYRMFRRRRS